MPTLAASYFVPSAGDDTGTLTTPAFTPATGEVLVVKVGTEGQTLPTIGTPTGGSQTYALRNDSRIANRGEVAIFTATVSGSPGSMTVAVTFSGSSGQHSMTVERWTDATLDATPATNATETGTGAPSATVTTVGTGSVVSWVCVDWNATPPGTPAYRSSATQDGLHDKSPNDYTAYYAYQNAASAGSQTIGLTLPSGQTWSMVGIEIRSATTGQTVQPTGIASTSAFGTALLAMTIAAGGIGSTVQFGTPTLGNVVSPTGIASTEAIGAPTVTLQGNTTVAPSGIASTEAFGTAVVFNYGSEASVFYPTAPSSSTSSDKGGINLGLKFSADKIGRVNGARWYCPAGWDGSAGTVWATLFTTAGAVLAQTSLATPVAGQWNDLTFTTPYIVSAGTEYMIAMYLPARATGADYPFTPAALASTVVNDHLSGLAGGFDYSSSQNQYPGNASTAWYGVDVAYQPSSTGGQLVNPTGIASTAAFGSPALTYGPITVNLSGVGSSVLFGLPVLNQGGPPAGYPTAATTGPTPGTSYTIYSGSEILSSTLYERVRFVDPPGSPTFYTATANGAVFRDCVFDVGCVFTGDNLRIERCEIVGGASFSGTANVYVGHTRIRTTRGDLVHITSDSGQCANITFLDCYIHDPRAESGDHADGFQVRGVQGLTIRHCSIDMGPWYTVGGTDVLNDCVFLQNANGGNSNVEIDACYINGAGTGLASDAVSGTFIVSDNLFGPDAHYAQATLTGVTPTLSHSNSLHVGGGQVPGIPDVVGNLRRMAGPGDTATFGTPMIVQGGPGQILPQGLPSTSGLGTPTLTVGTFTIHPTGVASTILFGQPDIGPPLGWVIAPTGLSSTVAFGQPVVSVVTLPTGRWRLVTPTITERFRVRGSLYVSLTRAATVFGDDVNLYLSVDGGIAEGADEWGAIPFGTKYVWYGGHINETDSPVIRDLWLTNGFEVVNV